MPYQLLTEVVPELRNDVHEAEEGVCLCIPRVLLQGVASEVVVQGRQQLVHALHVSQARVELGKQEQSSLHLLCAWPTWLSLGL